MAHNPTPGHTDVPAELALVGSILLDRTMLPEVIDTVHLDDLTSHAARMVWRAVTDLYERHGLGWDIVAVRAWLADHGILDGIGGVEKLVEIAESVPHAVAAPHYARRVVEMSRRRRIIEACERNLHNAVEGDMPVDALVDGIQASASALTHNNGHTAGPVTLIEALEASAPNPDSQGHTGIRTGFYDLDELIIGMTAGDMIVVAGRPSMGKTALGITIALNVISQNMPVLLLSLEMSQASLAQRIMSMEAGVPMHKIRRNMITAEEHEAIKRVAKVQRGEMWIVDNPGTTIEQIRSTARRVCKKHGAELIVIDYLQLMSGAGKSRYEQITNVSMLLKAMAKELSRPVLVMCQLNRAPEARTNNTPKMSDLRDSGGIEQDADMIMLLHRESYYHIDDPDWRHENPDRMHTAELIVAKNRQGPVGVVPLHWDAECVRFANAAKEIARGGV